MKEGARLPKAKQRRFNREEAIEIKKQLDELLAKGKIRPSRSESAVSTLFVNKADGTKRWRMDLRPINNITKADENKSPLQDSARERLRGAKYFTRLDMRDGYHHLRIKEGHEHLTAFLTEYGLYEWTVMCFGLRNAPAEFARYMSDSLREFLNEIVTVYFDDIIVFAEDLKTHWENVRKILTRIREKGINLKLKKCEFAVKETQFLGQIVDGETTRMQYEKLKAILEWPTPKSCKEIEAFRGLAGYYRQYIKRFSDQMKDLNERLRLNEFQWTDKEEKAFQKIKESYRKEPILILHDPEKQTWLHADTSDYAMGAEISQLDENGKRRPVLFYSRKLLPAEMNYTTHDKEMLAIVHTMKKFQHYLRGTKHPVIVKSDHRNLRMFMTTKDLSARQARWAEELSSYNFVIEHIKGNENKVADALSRRPDYKDNIEIERKAQMLIETEGGLTINKEMKLSAITFDTGEKEIKDKIKKTVEEENLFSEYEKDEDGMKRFKKLILVPKQIEEEIFQRYHDDPKEGHQGIARTIEKIQRNYYITGLHRKTKKYIANCELCNKSKNDYRKPTGKMWIEENPMTRPWQSITADFLEMPQIEDEITGMKLNEILVVVDRFSKFTVLIPTRKEATTEEIYELMWTYIFAVFGLPEQMTSDRDKIFKTARWEILMKNDGVRTILSTAHHQQTDGQSERKIQEVQTYFRIYMDFNQKNWKKICPTAQYAMNNAESAVTKETPNFAVFGRNRNEEGNEQGRMKIFHEMIKNELDWNKQIQKNYYDKGRVEAIHLKEGDRVYLRRRAIGEKSFNIRTIRQSSKYDYRKLGLFRVEKCLKYDNYKLKLPKRMRIHPVFHVSLLSKAQAPATRENIEASNNEYEVESILDKRTMNGQTEFLVKWLGYDKGQATWEPTRNLFCPDKVQAFEDSNSAMRAPEREFGSHAGDEISSN